MTGGFGAVARATGRGSVRLHDFVTGTMGAGVVGPAAEQSLIDNILVAFVFCPGAQGHPRLAIWQPMWDPSWASDMVFVG